MAYTKKNWQAGEEGGTPITADALNHAETQYDEAKNYTDSVIANRVTTTQLSDGLATKVNTSTYTAGLAAKANTADLAAVAQTGSYGDLANKPTIPAAYTDVQAAAAAPVQSVQGRTGAVTVSKADVGLGAVDNTSDASKPVSSATQTALNGKANTSHTHVAQDVTDFAAAVQAVPGFGGGGGGTAGVSSVNTRTGAVTLSKSDVGLANVDNTSDANKPVSSATQTALDGKAAASHTHPATQVTGLATVATSGAYADLTGKPTIPSQYTDTQAAAAAPVQSVAGKTGAVTLNKGDVGLANVDNTSDASKPVSTAQQTALDGKAATSHTHQASQITDFQSAVQATPGFGSGGASVITNTSSKLSRFYGIVGNRDATTVPIVTLGSSTSVGQGASATGRGFPHRLFAGLQRMFPKASGTEASPIGINGAAPSNGVYGALGAQGGTTSYDFLTETKVSQIAALSPALVHIMVGTNDSPGRDPALLKAAIRYWLDKLQAACPPSTLYVLSLPFQRMDQTFTTYTWAQYGQVQAQIAANDPNVVFFDLTPPFIANGVPGSDPFDFVGTDNLHPTDRGHDLLANQVLAKLNPSGIWQEPTVLTSLTATTAPTLSGTASEGNVLTLSGDVWSQTPSARTYLWRRNGDVISGASSSTYTLVAADAGTTVSGQVIATLNGYGPGSAWKSVTVGAGADTTNPTINNFTATPGDGQIALSWSASDNVGVTRYVLKRVSPAATLLDGTGTSFTDTSRTNGTQYSYTLDVYDAAGNTVQGSISATPAAAGATPAFQDSFNDTNTQAGSRPGWTASATGVAQTNGSELVRGISSNSSGYVTTSTNMPVNSLTQITLPALPSAPGSGDKIRLVARRGSNSYVAAELNNTGQVNLVVNSGTNTTYPGGTINGFVAGDTLGLEVTGETASSLTVRVLRNGVEVQKTLNVNGPTVAGFAGIYVSSTVTAFRLDDFVVYPVTV